MVHNRAEGAGRSIPAWAIVMLVLLCLVVGGWLAVRAVSAAICADYNSISNDICDRWHYDTPTEDAIPVPSGWRIAGQDLSCGSAGCSHRLYVLVPPVEAEEPLDFYIKGIQRLGWQPSGRGRDVRKGDLMMHIGLAPENVGFLSVPKKLAKPGFVYVSLGICGEATTCE